MKQSSPVDWWCLTTEEEKEVENIYLHELVEGHQLVNILARIKHAKAAVLINTTNSYELAAEFVTGIKEVSFPVVIIKRTDGSEVLNYISQSNSIQACVEAYSGVDINPGQSNLENAESGTTGKAIKTISWSK